MNKLFLLLIAFFPLTVLAHTGHDHSDGLHQTIAVIVIALTVLISVGTYKLIKYKNIKKRDTSK